MQRWLLIGAGGLVLLLLVLLWMKVRADPATEVDPDKLAAAQAENRRLSQPPRDPPQIAADTPSWRTRRAEPEVVDQPEERAEPQPERRRDLRAVGSPRAGMKPMALQPVGGRNDGSADGITEANTLYDRADYEGAKEAALKVLEDNPNNVRMLRVVVSSACIMGDHDEAATYYERLTRDRDRSHMRKRCSRYGVDLPE